MNTTIQEIDKQTRQVLKNTLSNRVLDIIAPVEVNDPDKLQAEADLKELAEQGYVF